jgi:hypothetical protein
MKNGVFFRFALTIPKKAVAAWKKAKLRDFRESVTGDHPEHEGGDILGGELSVEAKTLKEALEELESSGMELEKKDIEHWEKTKLDGKAHIRIETKGALKRDATVKQLLDVLKKRADEGEEFVHIASDGKDGEVELFGYLGSYDAYSSHFLPFLLLGAAACEQKGSGELVFLADAELTEEAVFVRATFSPKGVELVVHSEPQDITKKESRALEAGLGKGGHERIQNAHAAWISKFGAKQRRRRYAGKIGWLRPDGSFAIEPRFRSGAGFSEGLALVSEEGEWDYGFIDESGDLVIPHRFFTANGFKQGRAVAQMENAERGFIDRSGEWACEPKYSHAESFAEHRAVVGKGDLRGYIDLDGREVVSPTQYQYAHTFSEGRALVAEHDEYETGGFGFLDRDGKVVIPLGLERVGIFLNGRAPACRKGRWGFIDPAGKWLIEPTFEEAGYFINGRALCKKKEKLGLIDESGKVLIAFAYERLFAHGDWYVANTDDGECIVFSRDGKKLYSVPFESLGDPGDGLMSVCNSFDGPFGYVDFEGKLKIKPRFGYAAPFAGGLAIVEDDDGKWGIIDKSGKMKTVFDFKLRPSAGASHFAENGLAYIEDLSCFGLVHRDGRVIHPPEFSALAGFGEELIWVQYAEDLD